ncbi:hypothetical protein BBO99_00003750 [Phytophthora kernoviae]|uniref:EF-hand domain-containing protein n=3 Tax=Phytophthora kernoviae TaxID=325452 RepID=A0A3R7NHZ5_9STRA|nr:hypothetical protein G195_004331 [Phytophthora kernoviae 00238/432]KAG2527491.1 hypothetical protein JM16_003411 [Phytophthora kernoviae]KAG2528772.1 hypothetical protein JM18_002984 [Phytophthora kernoviae]RLN81383.1 hypothetical protein BBO99_00003750 [Phytophthora kernoviae]
MLQHNKRKAINPAEDAADIDASSFLEDAQRSVDFLFSSVVVLPGDDVTATLTKTTRRVKLAGTGLRQLPDERIVCTNAGVLRYRPANRYWVEFNHKRYVASMDDGVIGIVTDRNAEFYRVNIGAAATLGSLAFDGATKRNRPSLRLGSLVYARVSKTNPDVEPEITCEAPPSVTKKDWMTGLAIYGELNDGYVFKTSIGLAKSLLHEDCQVLASLGKKLPFEVAVGVNGVVWVHAKSTKNITIISNAIMNSETMSPSEVDAMVSRLLEEAEDVQTASYIDDAKGMIAQEERELRRVFDHLSSYRQKKKLTHTISDCKERRQRLESSRNNPEVSTLLNEQGVKMSRDEIEDELRKVDQTLEKAVADQVAAQNSNSHSRVIKNDDLYEAIKAFGKVCSKKEISDMIWEADENLDGVVDWEELRSMFNRNLLDRTELEPANLFNVVQFMTYDKKNCGIITADDTMAILFARYGQSQLEMRMKQLFGDSDELTFVDYLERVGKQRRSNVEARAKA